MEAATEPGGRTGLRVRLLGGFGLSLGNEPVTTVDAPRLQSLLAYLMLHRGDQPRERLAYLFWPDSDESQARTNLRQALHHLRRALPDSERFVETEARVVRWRADAPLELDVDEFERLLGEAEEARGAGRADDEQDALEEALALYGGDLVPDCYDDWVAEDRNRLSERQFAASERLAEVLEDAREYRRAVPLVRRLVDDEPLNEAFSRRLMRLQALSGDRAAALRVYHGLATGLAREMGVEPSAETQAEYERLLEPGDGAAPREAERVLAAASPLVGRDPEWESLREAWRRAVGGEAMLGVVSGEAGIGKSRLCEEFRDWVARQGYPVAASRCYAAAGGLAYAPLVELLRTGAIAPSVERLADPWLTELARLLPELLAERPELSPPPTLGDESQRVRLLDALLQAVVADERPLLVVIDDLQWCDSETLDWLLYLLRSRPEAPLLVVATARSEELGHDHEAQALLRSARAGGQAVEIDLAPLEPEETAALAANVSGSRLGEDRQELLHRETEGNPLFVVEWMRTGLLEEMPDAPAYEQPAETRKLPPRAHAVIEARLAQLSPEAQELAGLAATVGRAFTFDVLAAASSRGEDQVVEALDELWERRIVRERGVDAYDFSHDKLREAAYLRAGSARRRMLHRRVAQSLERLNPSDYDSVSGELGVHYDRAGWSERAIGFYARAAELAQGVYANERAVQSFSRALELLAADPESAQRDKRELKLRTALGAALVVYKGYGAEEVQDNYRRAWELCERLGTRPDPPVMRALGLVTLVRGDLSGAYELGREVLDRGRADEDQMARVEGLYLMGVASFWLGNFTASREELEAAIAEYRPETARSHVALYSQDARVICLSRLGYTLWFLGQSEQAEENMERALRFAEELEHPFSLAYALHFATWLALHVGDEQRARARAERMDVLAKENRLGYLQPLGTMFRGWMLAGEGRPDEGIALIRDGLETHKEGGWTLHLPHAQTLLARVCLDAGRLEEARHAITQGLELGERIRQRCLEAPLRLLMAESILAADGGRTEAESQLSAALEVARRQQAAPLVERADRQLEQLRAVGG